MKKSLIFLLFSQLVSFSNADDGCSSFVSEIETYQKKALPPMVVNKNFPLTDELIFTYPLHKDFVKRVDAYLNNVVSIEKGLKGNPCSALTALSPTDENKNGAIKRDVKKKLISNFDKALEGAYKRMLASSSLINLESCDGYGDHASSLIAKYYQSNSEQHSKWVGEAIKRYEECKQDESLVIATPIGVQQQSFETAPQQPIPYAQLTRKQINEKSQDCNHCENYKNAARVSPDEKNIQEIANQCQAFCSSQQMLLPAPKEEPCQSARKQAANDSKRWKTLDEECKKISTPINTQNQKRSN